MEITEDKIHRTIDLTNRRDNKMKTEIRYLELKDNGCNHNGTAWIGKVKLSKTGKTIYFNDKAFRKNAGGNIGGISNYYDVETGEQYWISGVKRDGTDRHWAGSGKILIGKNIVDNYLNEIGQTKLRANLQIVDIPEIYPIERITELDNKSGFGCE